MRQPFPHLFVLLTFASLALCNLTSAAEETQATPSSTVPLLMDANTLRQRVERPGLRLADVRSLKEYQAGHIPGAVHVDVDDWTALALAPGGLHNADEWGRRVGALGITKALPVVVYGGGNVTAATRIWWTLKYVGVEQVGILDGGWDAWKQADGPVSVTVPHTTPAEFEPEFQSNRVSELPELRELIGTREITIIDTRSDGEHTGTGGPGPRRGHLPGAVHQEWSQFVAADGRFKPGPEIKRLLQEAGLTPNNVCVTHCQSGGRASVNAFVMELAGFGPVRNYYCGWSEWSRADDAPVEQGGGSKE